MQATIQRAAGRSRNIKDRIRGHGITSRTTQDITLKGGDLAVRNLQTSVEVAPDGVVRTDFEVINGATSIDGPNEPDCCGSDCNVPTPSPFNGYEYTIQVIPEWDPSNAFENTTCIPTTEWGSAVDEYAPSFQAPPTAGTAEITIALSGAQSEVTGVATRLVTVCSGCPQDPGADQCKEDGHCPSGDCDTETNTCIPDNGGGGGGSGGFFSKLQNILLLLIIAAFVFQFLGD